VETMPVTFVIFGSTHRVCLREESESWFQVPTHFLLASQNGRQPNQHWNFPAEDDVREYRTPMVVFLQRLDFGEISRRELGFAEPDYHPSSFEFRPSWLTGTPLRAG
jgi:hypothetical protein